MLRLCSSKIRTFRAFSVKASALGENLDRRREKLVIAMEDYDINQSVKSLENLLIEVPKRKHESATSAGFSWGKRQNLFVSPNTFADVTREIFGRITKSLFIILMKKSLLPFGFFLPTSKSRIVVGESFRL